MSRGLLYGREIKTPTQFRVRAGDFLISRRQIIHGACGIVPTTLDGAIVSNEYATLLPGSGLLMEYFGHFVHTELFQMICFHSSVGVDVEKMVLDLAAWLRHQICVPPLPEQRAIAGILGTWDEAIALTERRLEAARQRKRGLMQQLLTGRRRFPEFAGQPWREVRLGEVGSCIRGVSYQPDDLLPGDGPGSVRLLRATNITAETIDPTDVYRVAIGRCSPEQRLLSGDLVICMSSGSADIVGKAALYSQQDDQDYTVGAFCAIFRPFDASTASYINHFVHSDQYRRALRALNAGTNIQNLKPSDIEGISLRVPLAVGERREIDLVLSDSSAEVNSLTRRLAALQEQKKGLMQQLLTGQVRVPLASLKV